MDAATVRVFMTWRSTSARQFANVFEFVGPNGMSGEQSPITAYDAAADACVAALRAITRVDVKFDRVVSSTWLAESGEYDPSRERSRPLGTTGNVADDVDAATVDLRNVLRIDRRAATGRTGRLFIRGYLAETFIQARSGRVEWATGYPDSSVLTHFTNFVAALAPFHGAGTNTVRLSLIGGTLHREVVSVTTRGLTHSVIRKTYIAPYIAREVTELVMMGPTMLADDHAYFDRP